MQRVRCAERADWLARTQAVGLTYARDAPSAEYAEGMPYWDEAAFYAFSERAAAQIRAATDALHALCLQAVDRVVHDDALLERFGIAPAVRDLVRSSWLRRDPDLYGRFDLAFDGRGPPKMLEYNADTPTCFIAMPGHKQFNEIEEALVRGWSELGVLIDRTRYAKASYERGGAMAARRELPELDNSYGPDTMHFCCIPEDHEDLRSTQFLEHTAQEAGLDTRFLFIDEVGWNGRTFVDLGDEPIVHLFKLYPWEWLSNESFSAHLEHSHCRFVEPPWKAVLSNKCILPLLYEMFPEHPNLLPAFWDDAYFCANGVPYVRKAILGREGRNVTVFNADGSERCSLPGEYGASGYVYQQLQEPRDFDGRRPVLGSWVVRGRAVGLMVREDATLITHNMSRVCPHVIDDVLAADDAG